MPSLIENKLRAGGHRGGPRPADHRPRRACATWPARSSGPRPPSPRPTTTRRAPRRPAASRRSRPPRSPPVYASYESAKQRDGALDFEDLLLVTAYALEEHPRRRPRGPRRSTGTSSSTSTRTSTRCSSGCSTPGSAAGPRSASSATPTRRSTPSPAPTPTTCWASPTAIPTPSVVKLERDYRSTPQVVGAGQPADRPGAAAQGAARAAAAGSAAPTAPEPTFAEHPDEPAEAAAVAARCRALIDAGHAGRGDRGAVPDQRPVARSTSRRWPTSACPYVLQGGERFFERPEVREAVLLLRGAAAGGSEPGALVPTVRDVLASTGWAEHRPPAGGAARDRWQSLAALVDLAVDLVAENPDARPRRLRRAPGRAGRRPARADRAGRHAGLDARRQGPGVGRRLRRRPGRRRAADRAVAAPAGAVEEERRLLYVAVTRAREQLSLSWSLARNPGAKRARPRSRFLDGLAPDSGRTRTGGPPAGASGRRWCSRARRASCSSGCGPGAARPPSRPRCPPTWSSPTRRCRRSPRPGRRPCASCPALPGIGARKLELYGEDVLAAVSG